MTNLLVIGCGNVGTALLNVWTKTSLFDQIVIVQPSLSQKPHFAHYPAIQFVAQADQIPAGFSPALSVLAIKPQSLTVALPSLLPAIGSSLLVSVLSGTSLATLNAYRSGCERALRLMPNLAMKIGLSVNLTYAASGLSSDDRNLVDHVFSPSGRMIWLEKETLIDLLTPISGSGPAYFFLLAEILVEATMEMGIHENTARELAQQVLIGSAGLVQDRNDFAALMAAVTSKGGVTEAALKVMKPGCEKITKEALQQALMRIKELSL